MVRSTVFQRLRLTIAAALVTTTAVAAGAAPGSVEAAPTTVAFVSRTVPAPGADAPAVAQLEQLGFQVKLVDDDKVRQRGERAIGAVDLIVISKTVYPSKVGKRLSETAIPIVSWNTSLYDDLGLTEKGGSNSGRVGPTSSLTIADPSSPLSAGQSGSVIVTTKPLKVSFGRPAGSAIVAAHVPGKPQQATNFSYDAGVRMANGRTAPARRAAIFFDQVSPRFVNPAGWAMFEAAIRWSAGLEPAPTDPGPSVGSIAPSSGALFGANPKKRGGDSRYEGVKTFEREVGRGIDVVNRFHEFSDGLDPYYFVFDRKHVADGRTVMISWRATDNRGALAGQPDPNRAKKITSGQFDREIDGMALRVRELGAPVLIRFNWEMDQGVGGKQHIGTPAEFIAAWRYIHKRFDRAGVSNVEWVWAPRAAAFNKVDGPLFYPGDAFVDWIGGSAVPIYSFRTPEKIYGNWYDWASERDKPLLLWLGLRENPDDSAWKAGFIDRVTELTTGPWGDVKAFIYYHSFSPEGFEYWADTSPQSLQAIQDLACSDRFSVNNSCS